MGDDAGVALLADVDPVDFDNALSWVKASNGCHCTYGKQRGMMSLFALHYSCFLESIRKGKIHVKGNLKRKTHMFSQQLMHTTENGTSFTTNGLFRTQRYSYSLQQKQPKCQHTQ